MVFNNFLKMNEVISRKLANFIFYVVDTYAGVSRKNIKVDEINPKLMLTYILKLLATSIFEINIIVYLPKSPSWKVAIELAQKYTLINPTELGLIYPLCEIETEDINIDYPEELTDIFTCEPLLDPVELPESKEIVNRQSIVTSLMDSEINPFNRNPLTIKQLDDYNLLPEVKDRCDKIKQRVLEFKP